MTKIKIDMKNTVALGKNEFKCEACGGIFEKGWSDEEADKEAKGLWGNLLGDNPAIICDDCFQKGLGN